MSELNVDLMSNKKETKEDNEKKGLKGDYGNLFILLLLYTLQGIPFGLLTAIPMILSTNNVSYEKQAIFSFANYPYTVKILWAPIADSLYWKKFGRRKSWLIPAQYLISVLLIVFSSFVDDLIGTKTKPPQIFLLTITMFIIIFFTATQDIAVDAWALTLLSRRNVHYASSCNAVGLILGRFISTTVFLALESPKFCNQWFRSVPQDYGVLSIENYFFGIGTIFAISTTLICIFKREESREEGNDEIKGICNTYRMFLKIIKLKGVLCVAAIHFTQFIAYSVVMNVTDLKLIQFGVRRETLSLLKAPIAILNLFIPFIIVRKVKSAPMTFFWRFGIMRLLSGLLAVVAVFWAESFHRHNNEFPFYFFIVLFISMLVIDIFELSHSMCLWSFCTMVSDPNLGATYMTLFSTFAVIGIKWTATVSLWMVDLLSVTKYVDVSKEINPVYSAINFNNASSLQTENTTSIYQSVSEKVTVIDGIYIEACICFAIGILWFICFKKIIFKLQIWPRSVWRVNKSNSEESENNGEDVKLNTFCE